MSFFFPVGFWVGVVWVLHGFQLAGLALGVLLYMCLVEAINLPHHAGIYIEEITPEAHLPIWDQYKVSRSCQYHPLIQKFVVLHFNYHAEHHLFPDLPWHQLDKAHKLLGDSEIKHELKVIGNSWMSQKRKESFGEFIRPHSEKKKSSEAA